MPGFADRPSRESCDRTRSEDRSSSLLCRIFFAEPVPTSVGKSSGQLCAAAVRITVLAAVGIATTACANEPLNGGTPRFGAPMMLLNSQAAAAEAPNAASPTAAMPPADPTHKSLAAKVLASRALETVTGLKTDPARLSEHD